MDKKLKGLDDGDVSLVRALEEVECLIPHKLYGHLIGKNGFRVQSIIRKFGVQVIFPEDKRSEKIRIRGRKKGNCEKAKQALLEVLEQVETFKIDKPSKHRVRRKKEKPNAVPLENRVDDVQKLLELVPVVAVKVDVPQKYHEYIMGKKGGNVKELMGKHHVRIDIPPAEQPQDFITVTGAPACVSEAKKEIEKQVEEKKLRPFQVEIEINPDFVGNLTGLQRSAINKIIRDQNVQIIFPKEGDAEMNIITINSSSEKTAKAAKEDVLKIVSKLKKEELLMNKKMFKKMKTKDKEIRKVKEEYKVDIRFSENTDPHLNLVTMVGPEDNLAVVKDSLLNNKLLDLAKKVPKIKRKEEDGYVLFSGNRMEEKVERLDDNNENLDCLLEEVECHIPHDLFRELMNRRKFKNIICQFGVEVMLLTDEKSDKVIIRGWKNCEKAKKALLLLLETAVKVYVPCKYHGFIIGKKGSNVNELKEKHHVDINFPHPDQHLDHITISGLPVYVGKAKQEIEEHWKKIEDKELRSFQLKIEVNPDFLGNMTGLQGSAINKIIRNHDVQIKFPKEGDAEKNIITITGYEEKAKVAREEIFKIVTKLKKEQVLINNELCRKLRDKEGSLQNVKQKFKVDIRFCDSTDSHMSFVTIVGPEENMAKVKLLLLNKTFLALPEKVPKIKRMEENGFVLFSENRMEEKVENLVCLLEEVECLIPHDLCSELIDENRAKLEGIICQFGVEVMFPTDEKSDKVIIRGRKNCEKAKKALLLLLETAVKVYVPCKYHGFIIGKKGSNVNELKEKHHVDINFPHPDQHLDHITISGLPAYVGKAKQEIEEHWKKIEDKELRSLQLKIKVDPEFYGPLIGKNGSVIKQIIWDRNVHIKFPKEGDAEKNIITITGYEEEAKAAKEDILKIVSQLEKQKKEQMLISREFCQELRGKKGKIDIQKLMQEFKVDIRFSDAADPDQSLVTIIGAEENPAKLKEYLQNEAFFTSLSKKALKKKEKKVKSSKNTTALAPLKNVVQKLLEPVPDIAVKVDVPQKYHEFIMGKKGGNMKELMRKHNVRIDIPPAEQPQDFITVTGAPACVSEAKKEIEKQIKEKELRPSQTKIEFDPDFLGYLKSLQGSVISQIIRDHSVEMKLPKEVDAEVNIITINSGNQKRAEAAKEDILKIVRKLKKKQVQMTKKKFREIKVKDEEIRKLMQEYKVDIRFSGSAASLVTIVGPDDNLAVIEKCLLDLAKKVPERLKEEKIEVVDDNNESIDCLQEEVECHIPYELFRELKKRPKFKDIVCQFGVEVMFPTDERSGIVVVRGRKNCEKALQKLLEQVESVKVSVPSEHQKGCNVRRKETLNAAPLENRADDVQKLLKLAPVVAVKVNVPQKYHEFIMGNKSGNMKELMRKHNVRIDIPPAEQQLDFITVTGMPACVSGANKEIEKQIEEKELRPFQIELEINPDVPDPDFLENLTGLQSSAINKIIRDYDVQIKFAKEGDAEMNIITINSSNQKTAEAAREDILKMVRKLKKKHVLMTEKMFRKMKDEQDSIQKVMQEYKVDIRFAGSLVSIVGPEDNLAVVKESLLNNTLLALAKKVPKIKQLKIEVDPDSLGNLIGPQRSVINQIIWDHDVQIKFPMEGDAEKNIITITGYEEKAKAAKEDILQIFSQLEKQKKEQMLISTDNELCKELRGKKGKIDIQKLMHESKVDIRFSDAADPGQGLVTIIGVEENLAKV